MTIFGVLGRIKLLAGYYLIVITERKLMGQICGHDIWRIENIEIIPFNKTLLHLNQKQVKLFSDSSLFILTADSSSSNLRVLGRG